MKYLFCVLILLGAAFNNNSFAQGPGLTFFEENEALPNGAEKLRSITMTGDNPAGNCAGYELREAAQDSARAIGANLISIKSQRKRTKAQPCDEITFAFYKVGDLKAAERRFSWSAGRPLAWADFKGGIPADAANSTAAETSCGIAIETSTVTPDNPPRVYVYNTFQTFASWVRPGESTVNVLEHEQGHWNICELYTRIMKQRFAAAKMDVYNLQSEVGNIYNSTQREYAARQQEYEQDTQHGVVRGQQIRWTALINKELGEHNF